MDDASVKELPPMLSGSASGHYATPVTVLPRAIDDVLYPSQGVTLPAAGIVMILSLGVALGTGAWRRRRWLLLAGVAMSVVGVGNAMATEMYSVGDYPRFGMQEGILLRIGLIILVVVAVDSVLTRRRSADPATPVPTGSRRSSEPELPDEPELVEAAPPI